MVTTIIVEKPAMTCTERTIAVEGARIRLTESAGAGLPILLLHGSGMSRAAFDGILAGPLAERHRLVAMDLPGHGDSGDAQVPVITYTLTGLTSVVRETLTTIGVDRVVVFGWSLGGHIAIELMHHHAGVTGLMLMGAPPVSRGPLGMLRAFHANWDMLLASKERYAPRDIRRYAQLCFGDKVPPEMLAAIKRSHGSVRSVFSNSMMRGDGADQRRTVEESIVPIAFVNGEHDPFIRLSYFEGLHMRSLWDGHAHVLAGAGHAAFLDAPQRFEALLMRFASEVEMLQPAGSEVIARRA